MNFRRREWNSRVKERERNGKGVAEKESIRKRKRKGWKEMVARKRSILEPPR